MKLYGWTWNPLIWLSIIIHDWGYFDRRNMDGDEYGGGAWHPTFAYLFFSNLCLENYAKFCILHSRFIAKIWHMPISRLGVADKLAIVYTPTWMYCREELDEYISHEKNQEVNCLVGRKDRVKLWKQVVDAKCHEFVNEWKDKAYALHQY